MGVEGEIEARLPGGTSARFSHAAIRTRHEATGAAVSNSPRHTSKAGIQVPLARLMAGFEGQFVGERLTIGGEPLPSFFVSNLTLTSPVGRGLELTLGVYNAFDVRYADPGAEEHRQGSIPQDGRTVLARVRFGF
jgi:iron complex outermembrane receptor protein